MAKKFRISFDLEIAGDARPAQIRARVAAALATREFGIAGQWSTLVVENVGRPLAVVAAVGSDAAGPAATAADPDADAALQDAARAISGNPWMAKG